jgi:hypothetical protein
MAAIQRNALGRRGELPTSADKAGDGSLGARAAQGHTTMNAITIRLAAAGILGLAATTGAQAQDWFGSGQAYVQGSGENQTVAYDRVAPNGIVQPAGRVSGSGENVSAQRPATSTPAPRAVIAVVEGSGENLSVRYLPAPRG